MCLSPSVSAPDTSAADAEAKRQADASQAAAAAQLAQQQKIADANLAATKASNDKNTAALQAELKAQQDAINRQAAAASAAQAAAAAQAEQQRQAAEAAAAKKAADAQAYATGRTGQISTATQGINDAYSGFDQNYYDKFSKDYVDYYNPQLQSEYDTGVKNLTYKYGNQGGLDSSAAAGELSQLLKAKNDEAGQIASGATNAANNFQSSVNNQKQTLLSQALSASNIGPDVLPDGVDVNTSLNSISSALTPYVGLAKSQAGATTNPNFSTLSSAFGDLTTKAATSAGSGAGTTSFTSNNSGLYQPPTSSPVRIVA